MARLGATRRRGIAGLGKLSFLMAVWFVVLASQAAYAEDNPRIQFVPVWYRDDQGNEDIINVEYKLWDPANNGWDDVYCTHGDHVKFKHLFPQEDWPIDGITADDGKRYYDVKWDQYKPDPSDDSTGTASLDYNCHSYAFGRTDYWVISLQILNYDYTYADKSDATVGYFSSDHSVMILDQWQDGDCWKIPHIRHKDRTSAIFDYVYDDCDWDLKLAPVYAGTAMLLKPGW